MRLLFYKAYSLLWGQRYLPVRQAIHIPVLIHPCVKFKGFYRGAITFIGPVKSSMLSFGFEGTTGQSNCQSLILIKKTEEGLLLEMTF